MIIIRLLRFFLLAVGIYLLYKFIFKGGNLGFSKSKKNKQRPQKIIDEMKKDPVCGTYIPKKQAVFYKINHTGYYFCSEECKKKFQELEKSP